MQTDNEVIIPGKNKQPANKTMVKELIAVNTANKNRTAELIDTYHESDKVEELIQENVRGLDERMIMAHKKLRQPVANILAMASLIEQHANSPLTLKKIVKYIKRSALDLDAATQGFTALINDLEKKAKTVVQ